MPPKVDFQPVTEIKVLVIVGYLIFNKFIVPVWERYAEKPIITKEVP